MTLKDLEKQNALQRQEVDGDQIVKQAEATG
jgi:hypothetical protein